MWQKVLTWVVLKLDVFLSFSLLVPLHYWPNNIFLFQFESDHFISKNVPASFSDITIDMKKIIGLYLTSYIGGYNEASTRRLNSSDLTFTRYFSHHDDLHKIQVMLHVQYLSV